MATEGELIGEMQRDTALVKKALARMAENAADLVTINHTEGRPAASADAMAWQSAIHAILSQLLAAHGEASKALMKHYGDTVVMAGPIR